MVGGGGVLQGNFAGLLWEVVRIMSWGWGVFEERGRRGEAGSVPGERNEFEASGKIMESVSRDYFQEESKE